MINTDPETNYEFQPAEISENANVVLEKRYLQKNSNGDIIETPNEMFKRVAKALVQPEKNYEKSDDEMKNIENDFYLDRIKRLQPNTIDLDYLDETFRKVTGFTSENETVIIIE